MPQSLHLRIERSSSSSAPRMSAYGTRLARKNMPYRRISSSAAEQAIKPSSYPIGSTFDPGSGARRSTVSFALVATKEEKIEMEGEVVEAFPNGMFKIQLDAGHEVLGYTAGKMRRFRIKIFPGDRVKVEVSPYDLTRGRIVYRYR